MLRSAAYAKEFLAANNSRRFLVYRDPHYFDHRSIAHVDRRKLEFPLPYKTARVFRGILWASRSRLECQQQEIKIAQINEQALNDARNALSSAQENFNTAESFMDPLKSAQKALDG